LSSVRTKSSKESPTTTLTGSSLVSGIAADLKWADKLPDLKSSTALESPSAERSSTTNLFNCPPSKEITLTVGSFSALTPTYSASLAPKPVVTGDRAYKYSP